MIAVIVISWFVVLPIAVIGGLYLAAKVLGARERKARLVTPADERSSAVARRDVPRPDGVRVEPPPVGAVY